MSGFFRVAASSRIAAAISKGIVTGTQGRATLHAVSSLALIVGARADRLAPDRYLALARAVYAEMALAGITCVGEFHYLHHQPGGVAYDDPNEMSNALVAAAAEVGVRLTLLDTCYLHGGIGVEPNDVQRRFSDGSVEQWAERVDALRVSPGARVGAAIHSVRAVDPASIGLVSAWAARTGAPLHAHVSEQRAENEQCVEAFGLTPTALLAEHGALGPAFTAVHATHLSGVDIGLLGTSGSSEIRFGLPTASALTLPDCAIVTTDAESGNANSAWPPATASAISLVERYGIGVPGIPVFSLNSSDAIVNAGDEVG